MQLIDFSTLRTIPGFNEILKAVLKAQIQTLVEKLHDETGEESLLLTASVSDGSLCYLGSRKGQGFLDRRQDIKTQFIQHCLNGSHDQNHVHVADKCDLPQTIVAGEINSEARNRRNKTPKHKQHLNDVKQDTSSKIQKNSQQLHSVQQRTIENIPVSDTYPSQLIQQNKGQFVQRNFQQLPVLNQTTDKAGLYLQNVGQHLTLSLLPNGNHVAVSPNANNLSVLPSWTNVFTPLSGHIAPVVQSGSHISLPLSGNTFPTQLVGNHVSFSRGVNHLQVSATKDHISASRDHEKTRGNNVSVVEDHKLTGGNHDLSERNHVSASVSQLSGNGNNAPSQMRGDHVSDGDTASDFQSRKQFPVSASRNQVTLSQSGNHVLLTPSGNNLSVTTNRIHDTKITTTDNLINQCVVNPATSLSEPVTSKCADKEDQEPLVSMETLLVNTVNIHNSVLNSDVLSSGFADTDRSSIENKDKTKKTLSSKIEEITERIKKDDPQKGLEDEMVTTDVPQVLAPEVRLKGGTTKSENQKTRQRKSGKSKDTSRASHRKPKLPRYNIGAASDEEEAVEEEDLSSIDILDIAAGIDDSNSSFAHINLDEFGDGIILKESETDMPLAGLFTCNNEDETNKTVIQNVFNLKPTEHVMPEQMNDETTNKINNVSKDTSISKSVMEIKSATENGTKKSVKEVSLINKKLWLKCSLCPVRFPNQDMLKQHMQTVIHRKKKYVCDLCGWKFGQLRDKERHRRTHTGERPFKCDVCNKTFARKDNLKLHERKHKIHVKV